jgi:transcriptional regulator with XRE-family HTH domain
MTRARSSTKTAPSPEPHGIPFDDIGAAQLNRQVAEKVRHLRRENGYSLDELSKCSGVSRASLSQIEQCKTNPTLGILWKIAAGLQVPFSTLLGTDRVERARLLRWQELQVLRSSDGGMESRPLMPAGVSPGVECYELKVAARGISRSEPHAHGTRENITVLTGTLRVHVGDDRFQLSPGDSLFFAADVPHAYENAGRVEARCLDLIIYGRAP